MGIGADASRKFDQYVFCRVRAIFRFRQRAAGRQVEFEGDVWMAAGLVLRELVDRREDVASSFAREGFEREDFRSFDRPGPARAEDQQAEQRESENASERPAESALSHGAPSPSCPSPNLAARLFFLFFFLWVRFLCFLTFFARCFFTAPSSRWCGRGAASAACCRGRGTRRRLRNWAAPVPPGSRRRRGRRRPCIGCRCDPASQGVDGREVDVDAVGADADEAARRKRGVVAVVARDHRAGAGGDQLRVAFAVLVDVFDFVGVLGNQRISGLEKKTRPSSVMKRPFWLPSVSPTGGLPSGRQEAQVTRPD